MPSLAIAFALAGAAAWLLACGPFPVDLVPVTTRRPADEPAFAKGELGVVRPAFSLQYLIQAYRTLAPQPPAGDRSVAAPATADSGSSTLSGDPVAAWTKRSVELLGPAKQTASDRQNRKVPGSDYQTFLNCPDGAFAGALQTLQARTDRFGAGSAQVRDWARAQVAVFENCHDGPLSLPTPAAADADELTRADRAYQMAAAYFYAMEYGQAVARFRAIGADRGSSWRPAGRYLAARANIRFATVPAERPDRVRLSDAETDLRAALADPAAAPLHPPHAGFHRRRPPSGRSPARAQRLTVPAPRRPGFVDYRFILNSMQRRRGGSGSFATTTRRLAADAERRRRAGRACGRARRRHSAHWLVRRSAGARVARRGRR